MILTVRLYVFRPDSSSLSIYSFLSLAVMVFMMMLQLFLVRSGSSISIRPGLMFFFSLIPFTFSSVTYLKLNISFLQFPFLLHSFHRTLLSFASSGYVKVHEMRTHNPATAVTSGGLKVMFQSLFSWPLIKQALFKHF